MSIFLGKYAGCWHWEGHPDVFWRPLRTTWHTLGATWAPDGCKGGPTFELSGIMDPEIRNFVRSCFRSCDFFGMLLFLGRYVGFKAFGGSPERFGDAIWSHLAVFCGNLRPRGAPKGVPTSHFWAPWIPKMLIFLAYGRTCHSSEMSLSHRKYLGFGH